MQRAILFADLVGYSALMGRDELGTLEFMVGCSQMIDENSRRYGGELVQTTGDGYLILFGDPASAVDFGVELHQLVAKRQTGVAIPAQFRVGIHMGQVHRASGAIHGHAVNIAARLESEARAGSCIVSKTVHDAVRDRSPHVFEAAGSPPLKNIAERIPLYRVPSGKSAPAPREAPVCISVIGSVTVTSNEHAAALSPRHRASALVGYLALAPGMRERDDKLARLLWPHLGAASARRALAGCRSQLSQLLGEGFADLVFSTRGHTGLNELSFDTDLALLLKDLRRGRVPALLAEQPEWPERILEGFDDIGPMFSTWRRVTCATWRNRILTALADILARSAPDEAASRDAATAILALEPGNEVASAALIRHHHGAGNRAAALDEFDRLSAYLETRHGLAPSQVVRDAVAEARGGLAAPDPAPRPAAARSPAPSRLLRIAVSQFGDPADGTSHLVSGFRSELTANLARFREWSVVERDGFAAGTGATAGPARCDYVIAGTCHGGVPPVLQLQLIAPAEDRIVWSEAVPLESATWSAVQRDVVGRIAAHVETYVSSDRLANLIRGADGTPSSYDAWLQAEQLLDRWSPEAADEAEAILEGIIETDPRFARAHSSLASLRNVRHVICPGLPRDAAMARSADALAQRAVELDPLDARNQLAVAWTAALTGAFDRAAIHLDLAASLNPNCPATLISCAMGHAFNSQADRGEALVAHALRISPVLGMYQWCYIASVHFLAGRYDEALKATQISGDRIVDNQGWTTATLVRLGRMGEARAAVDRLIDAVRPVWAGAGKPTAEAVFDWFVGAYPLRRAEDREVLAASLEAAMRGQ